MHFSQLVYIHVAGGGATYEGQSAGHLRARGGKQPGDKRVNSLQDMTGLTRAPQRERL